MTGPNLRPPDKSIGDHAHTLVKAGLNIIPVFGGTAAELLGAVISPPLERRRNEWMLMIADSLSRLEAEEPARFARLAESDEFASVAVHAAQAAIRAAESQKRRLLANAVRNSARGIDIRGDIQVMFVRFLDELTATHIAVLATFAAKESGVWNAQGYSDLQALISDTPGQQPNAEEFLLICRDLDARVLIRLSDYLADVPGLVERPVIVAESDEDSRLAYVTGLGKSFLAFTDS